MNQSVKQLKTMLKWLRQGHSIAPLPVAETYITDAITEIERLETLIAAIDKVAPRADKSCDDPGITLSVAVARELRDRNHPLFVEVTP